MTSDCRIVIYLSGSQETDRLFFLLAAEYCRSILNFTIIKNLYFIHFEVKALTRSTLR